MKKESDQTPIFSRFLKTAFFGVILFTSSFSLGNNSATSNLKNKLPTSHSKKSVETSEKIWVGVSSGALICDDPKELNDLTVHEKILSKLKIKVFESKSANDGKMRAQMCGIPKGDEHQFLILKKDLKKAEKNGFKQIQLMNGASSSSP